MTNDYSAVAKLHITGINQGFLSSLGEDFLALLYQAIDESENSTLIVHRLNGDIVGFVAGAQGLGEIYKIILKHWWKLFVSLLPSLFSLKKIERILETVFYEKKSAKFEFVIPDSELLSIVVKDEYRGQGIAGQLLNELAEYFRSRDIDQFKIIVGESLMPAHQFYLKMGAVSVGEIMLHGDNISIVYVYDCGFKREITNL